ncbi:tripartite motif-containing protein 2-like [Ptychodera flava]|uniref:tripartite motif-containing protein 2-like n=1 Tax=Ptychodera flava TaxID=63121 RepID=UPI003969F6E5
MGVSVNPINGRVYVVDNKGHCVLIYNQDGSYNRSFGSFGSHEGQLRHPRYVFVDHSGNVYVSDCVNHRIQVFDGDGRFLFAFGRDQLYSPTGLAVDKHGYVYVTDNINDKILKYDRQGEFVCRIDDTRDGLKNPIGVCVTDDFISSSV